MLSYIVCFEFRALQREIRPFGIGLRVDGYVFPGGHGHRPSHEAGYTGDQNIVVRGMRRGNAQHKARGGKDAIVCT